MRSEGRPCLLLGAHVSTAGGLELSPSRGAEIGAEVIQIFTKQVQRWAEPDVAEDTANAFRRNLDKYEIQVAGSHDSYLINLASPDPALWQRSYRSFCLELSRCRKLGLDFLVTHPGNATDGERAAGLRRNADAIRRALSETEGTTPVLLEVTAGQGTSLGCNFEELQALLERVGPEHQGRLGVCLDTAHLFAAGYDLVHDYDKVMDEMARTVGLERVRLLHLNDSKAAFASRVDRHEQIAEGQLGVEPFRRVMRDPRFRSVPKVIETPKGDDPVMWDRRNLTRLRRLAEV